MPTKLNLSDKVTKGVITNTVDLLRVSNDMLRLILRDLNELEKELLNDLDDAAGKTDFTLARLRALLSQVKGTIGTAFNKIAVANEKGLIDAVDAVVSQTTNLLNASIGASVISVGWSKQTLEAIAKNTLFEGRIARDWWAKQEQNLRERFAAEMRMGQLRGETIDQLAQRIRGTKALNYSDGIMQATRSQAQALVRTAVLGVSNEGRLQTYLDNRDVIKGVRWLSTLDSRTTEICIALDGLEWRFPKDGENYADFIPVGHDKEFSPPPAHWNCRSVLVPTTYSWAELAGEHGNSNAAQIADQIPEGERSSMDGQVGDLTTMADWLNSRTDEEIDAQLGKGRAELWRSGAISLTDLIDKRMTPLTLEQLQASI